MPNWCHNYVSFQGERAGEVIALLNSLDKAQDGKAFLIYENSEKAIFDFYDNEDGQCVQFETRWAPEFDSFARLSQDYDIVITIDYHEPGCMIFGKATFHPDGAMVDVYLNDEDFPEYDEVSDLYYFINENGEKQFVESEQEYLEQKLESKINGTKI